MEKANYEVSKNLDDDFDFGFMRLDGFRADDGVFVSRAFDELGNPATGTRFFRFTLFDENGVAIPGAMLTKL